MRARQERERDIFSRVQRSMAYDQVPAAEQRLTRARENGDEEEIARATRVARSCSMPSSNTRPTGAPLILRLQILSRHVENTFLRYIVGTSSPGAGSKNRESANAIAFCVAMLSLEHSFRIWKRQNFFAISSWRVLIG
jgi:hypothetical protein